jgi:quinol monooxygenase YgiN
MIRVIAIVTVKEGKSKNYLEEVYKIMPLVHIEDGCIEYGPHIDIDSGISVQKKLGPDTVAIIERWESLEALKKHGTTPHMNNFRRAVKTFMQSMELMVLMPA